MIDNTAHCLLIHNSKKSYPTIQRENIHYHTIASMHLLAPFGTSNIVINLWSSPVGQQSALVNKKEKTKGKWSTGLIRTLPAAQGRWFFPSILHWRDTYEVSQNNLKFSLILVDSIFYLPGYNGLLLNLFSSIYGQKAFHCLPNLLKFDFFFQYILFLLQVKLENGKRKYILPGNHPHFCF